MDGVLPQNLPHGGTGLEASGRLKAARVSDEKHFLRGPHLYHCFALEAGNSERVVGDLVREYVCGIAAIGSGSIAWIRDENNAAAPAHLLELRCHLEKFTEKARFHYNEDARLIEQGFDGACRSSAQEATASEKILTQKGESTLHTVSAYPDEVLVDADCLGLDALILSFGADEMNLDHPLPPCQR
jgi:hypothetical protein